MSREQSGFIKGIAIIIMMLIHLNISACNSPINDLNIWTLLKNICVPVPLFLIVGGYGLYAVNKKNDNHRFSRIKRSYFHYWLITFVFVLFGSMMKPEVYPGSFYDVVMNTTCFHTTYNWECWFLFPYSILSLSAVYIFRKSDRMQVTTVLAISFLLYLISGYLISRLHVQYKISSPVLYNLLYIFYMQFCFILGAMANRVDFFAKIQCYRTHQLVSVATLLVLSTMMVLFHITPIVPFFAFTLITCMIVFSAKSKIITFLGKHSINIWITHTWFLYYLFSKEVYSLQHPLLIIIALLTVSSLTSIIVNKILASVICGDSLKSTKSPS